MRRAAALAFIPVLAAVTLAGCSSSSSSSKPAAAASSSSSNSSSSSSKPAAAASPTTTADTYKSVTVSGAFNKAPTVTIPKETGNGPLLTKTLIQGTGAKLTSSEAMFANYVAYDWSGKTSKLLGSSYTEGAQSLFAGQLLPGLETALVGQRIGSRVLAVLPPADAFGTQGNSQEGIGASDTIVFVVDMNSAFSLAGATGKQTSSGGGALPTVVPSKSASVGPTIDINTKAAPPKTLKVETLIKGTGAVVKKGDEVAAQYNGYLWRTGKSFQDSWSIPANEMQPFEIGKDIPGFDTALTGQTVGSRVLMVIPPAEGYGSAGNSQAGIEPTDTLVFVVDILDAVQA
jgi:FKBP-type peptidyl-prolyl cis-trans isomerase